MEDPVPDQCLLTVDFQIKYESGNIYYFPSDSLRQAAGVRSSLPPYDSAQSAVPSSS